MHGLGDAAARGSVSTTICAIITKNRIRSAYSSTAEMLRDRMAWSAHAVAANLQHRYLGDIHQKKLELSRPTNRWLTLMALVA